MALSRAARSAFTASPVADSARFAAFDDQAVELRPLGSHRLRLRDLARGLRYGDLEELRFDLRVLPHHSGGEGGDQDACRGRISWRGIRGRT